MALSTFICSTQLFYCVGGNRAPAPSPPTADRTVGLHCTSKECARLKHAPARPLESAHIALHSWAKSKKSAKNEILRNCQIDRSYLCLQRFDKFWKWKVQKDSKWKCCKFVWKFIEENYWWNPRLLREVTSPSSYLKQTQGLAGYSKSIYEVCWS